MNVALTLICLVLPGVLPAFALAGAVPEAAFLSPLLGAIVAALAAVGELTIAGSFVTWYVTLAILAQVLAVSVLRGRRKEAGRKISLRGRRRDIAAMLLVVSALVWPLSAMRARLVGYDAHAIWVLHGMFISGGHSQLVAGLKDPAYAFSNPDYPPLVPAASALGFAVADRIDYGVAVSVTALLNGSALALVGLGVAKIGTALTSRRARLAAILTAPALCLAGFGIAGVSAVNGYADLLWAAAATASIVFGLVLPRSRSHMLVAVAAATSAALTKNEGLVASLIILSLMSFRYFAHQPLSANRIRRQATMLAAAAAPGLAWAAAVRFKGVGDNFFGAGTASVRSRLQSTISGLTPFLHIVLPAMGVLVLGSMILRAARRRAGAANAAWLWVALAAWFAVLLYTYTFGNAEIHWWIRTSADRTMIFPQLVLCAEISIWGVLACEPRLKTSEAQPRIWEQDRAPVTS